MPPDGYPRSKYFLAIITALLVAASSCTQPFSLKELVDGPDGKALGISPESTVLQINDTLPIAASGGIPPYSYAVVSGSGTFVGNVYTAPPSPGTERLRVTDKAGTAREAVITVENATGTALGITPGSGTVSTGGVIDFTAVGGTGPFEFSVSGGSGGTINSSTGVYTAGHFAGADTVTVTDTSDASSASAAVTVQAKPLAISPAGMTVYTGQTIQFAGVGGDNLFSFTVSGGSGGVINATTGLYTAGQTPGTDTVVLTDAYDGRTSAATVTVQAMSLVTNVDYAAGAVENIVSADVLAGSGFDAEFTITNAGSAIGTQAISWTVYASLDTVIGGADDRIAASGSLAGGLASGTSATVALSDGTGGVWPSEAGDYYLLVDVYAADDLAPGDNRNRSAGTTGVYEPVRMSPAAASASTGQSVAFTVTGGTGSYTYAVTTAGSGSPVFAGGVYTAGASAGTDILTVSDAAYAGAGWTASATVTVLEKSLSISPGTITVFVNQAVSFSAIGGTGPAFTYAVSGTSGGAINASTGAYTAGPNPGVDTVVLTDTYDGRTRAAAVTVVDTATNVDYAAGAITNIVPADILAGSGFTAEFSIVNGGGAAGSRTISWTVYASLDTVIGGADDRIAASGSLAGTPAGSTTPVLFGGVWPSEAGAYYLLVEVSAADDLTPGDNRNRSAGTTGIYAPLSISPAAASVYTGQQVDFTVTGGTGVYAYTVTTAGSGAPVFAGGVYTAGASAGTDTLTVSDSSHPAWTASASVTVSAAPPPPPGDVEYKVSSFTGGDPTPDAGSAIGESFTLYNAGIDAGSASVNWTAYVSQNSTPAFTVGDIIVDSGYAAALAGDDGMAGGPDEVPVATGGNWPSTAGVRYLKVKVWADDETTPNEWFVSGMFDVQPVSAANADYYVSAAPAGGSGITLGDPVAASFTVTNLGPGAGTQPVSWYAYISADQFYGAGDTLADSGSFGGLAVAGSTGAIAVDGGTWNAVGNWYLVIRLETADDGNTMNNQAPSSAMYTVSDPVAPAPDYAAVSISRTFPIVTADSAVSETFTITNLGGNGTADLTWTAFASADTVLGGDTIIGSGTIPGGLAAGASVPGIAINGFWPNLEADFHIIIRIDAVDETSGDADGVSASTIAVRWPPDYLITGTVLTPIDNGGNVNETLQSAGGGVRPGFRIRENYGQDGLYAITWRVFKSADQSLGGDTQIAFGTLPPLPAGQTSALIEFSDTLPASRGMFYYIIQVSSPDDRDLTNNVFVTPPMYVWSDGDSADGTADGADGDNAETDTTEDDIYFYDMGDDFFIKLNPGDSAIIRGIVDSTDNFSDVFAIRTGPTTTVVNFTLTWISDSYVALFLYDENDVQIAYTSTLYPYSMTFNVSGLIPSSYYKLDVRTYTYDNAPPKDQSYTLSLTAP